MNRSNYLAKLRTIRDEFLSVHVGHVMTYPRGNPREALERILSSYVPVEALDRIVEAETAKMPPPEVAAANGLQAAPLPLPPPAMSEPRDTRSW